MSAHRILFAMENDLYDRQIERKKEMENNPDYVGYKNKLEKKLLNGDITRQNFINVLEGVSEPMVTKKSATAINILRNNNFTEKEIDAGFRYSNPDPVEQEIIDYWL